MSSDDDIGEDGMPRMLGRVQSQRATRSARAEQPAAARSARPAAKQGGKKATKGSQPLPPALGRGSLPPRSSRSEPAPRDFSRDTPDNSRRKSIDYEAPQMGSASASKRPRVSAPQTSPLRAACSPPMASGCRPNVAGGRLRAHVSRCVAGTGRLFSRTTRATGSLEATVRASSGVEALVEASSRPCDDASSRSVHSGDVWTAAGRASRAGGVRPAVVRIARASRRPGSTPCACCRNPMCAQFM